MPSSSLVPGNDPTLLFTNAGMVQFKDVFLGKDRRDYVRAASSQRCVRAGGKHNDLENVGYTARHQTFFEMLGNFSFGDYFKRDAIRFAWEFLTGVLQLPPERLWVTVYQTDDEAARDLAEGHRHAGRRASRAWARNPISGPWAIPARAVRAARSSLITARKWPAGRRARPMRTAIATSRSGTWCSCSSTAPPMARLTPLPKPSVDTGMGLERMAAVMQKVHSVFEMDLFDEAGARGGGAGRHHAI